MRRHTLSCCLVVRNEEKRIKDCLDRINILADEIVIVDTGSTDRTCDVIVQWTKIHRAERNVKLIKVANRFHDEDGDFNFGAAKTFAFQNARMGFVMWLDAADQVTNQKKIKRKFIDETTKNPNVYFVLPTVLSKNFAFNRTRIGMKIHARMEGRVHETMQFSVPNLKRIFIPIHIQNFKRDRDLRRNLRILKKDWNEKKSGRVCFYIGNTYRDLADNENALKWFRKRNYEFDFKDDFKEEHFKSIECMAEILIDKGATDDLYDVTQEMIEKEPKRFEGYYYLGRYYMEQKEWQKAINELRKYKTCRKPSLFRLWLNRNIYNGKEILRAIEQCKMELKHTTVLMPESITDYGAGKSTYKRGNAQYL